MRLLSCVLCALAAMSAACETSPTSSRALAQRVAAACLVSAAPLAAALLLVRGDEAEDQAYAALHRTLLGRHVRAGDSVLEVGYGSGANDAFYPRVPFALQGLDPKGPPARRGAFAGRDVLFRGVLRGVGEALPFADGAFDVVVASLVLCSVRDPPKVLAEISRALRPGGRFVSIEHVLGDEGSALAAQQRLLDPLQQVLADGCHLSRRTDQLLLRAVPSLFARVEEMTYLDLPSQWPISKQVATVMLK